MLQMDLNTLFSLQGKVAMVTGGSRGIGKMITQGLLQAGAKVYITARKKAACEEAAKELSAFGPCIAIPSDIGMPEGRAALLQALGQKEDKLHILINNAGTNWGEEFDKYPDEAFEKVLHLNVSAVFSMTRDFIRLLERAATSEDPARVINIGSMDGLHIPTVSQTGTFAYTSSKAAVHHLYPEPGGNARSASHHRERHRARFFPEQDDGIRLRRTSSGYRRKQPSEARGKT
jgi:NAD(P)-dependent dehydrogenase (short-subunit alcohol dehydrogenase family)